MPTHHPHIPNAPEPSRVFFDPFNSSSTGHQRAENRLSGSTSWRDSRQYKLADQFGDTTGKGGKQHLFDLVGAGSENYGKDGKKDNGSWERGASGLREKGWQDIRDMMGSRKRKSENEKPDPEAKKRRTASEPIHLQDGREFDLKTGSRAATAPANADTEHAAECAVPQIFRGLTIYINGSTMPLISDHRLKQQFAQRGGNSSIALGRRTVTHVILGEVGRGGGLASTKIQKENTTVHGKGIKYVSVRWVLDSIEKGIRQPESRYAVDSMKNKLGGSGQGSVATLFRAKSG